VTGKRATANRDLRTRRKNGCDVAQRPDTIVKQARACASCSRLMEKIRPVVGVLVCCWIDCALPCLALQRSNRLCRGGGRAPLQEPKKRRPWDGGGWRVVRRRPSFLPSFLPPSLTAVKVQASDGAAPAKLWVTACGGPVLDPALDGLGRGHEAGALCWAGSRSGTRWPRTNPCVLVPGT
jgi:hypothetical protein